MLVSENRPEWLIADLGIMAAGCVTVPTYTTNTTRDHTHILDNSGARAVIVSTQKLAKTLVPAVLTSAECHHIIGIDDIRTGQAPDEVDCPSLGRADRRRRRRRGARSSRSRTSGASDLACIIYTSGTGGAPRGVRQHHGAILHNVEGAPTSSRPTSAGTTKCSCRSCPRATPMSIPAGSISRSGSARRSITPKASRSSPPISRRCSRRSWSSCRACSRCFGRAS